MDKSINSNLHRRTAERFKRLRILWTSIAAHRLKPLGVVPNQAHLLRTVHRLGACSLAEISAATLLDPAAVVRVADSLAALGLLNRQEHPTDRRRWLVRLSPEGRKMAVKFNQVHDGLLREIFSPLTEGELRRFNGLLERLWTPHDPARRVGRKNDKRNKP